MPQPSTRIGHISDLAGRSQRADWSELNAKIRTLEPGGLLTIECPPGFSIGKFRSTVLTNGRRIHVGKLPDWKISTRTDGRKLHVFLSPVEPLLSGLRTC